jgi:hypothetical protein
MAIKQVFTDNHLIDATRWGYLLVAACLVVWGGCDHSNDVSPHNHSEETQGGESKEVEDHFQNVIRNMPMNDGESCMGIAITVEAILEAHLEHASTTTTAQEMAVLINENKGRHRLKIARRITIASEKASISSAQALSVISSLVNLHCQEDHKRLLSVLEMGQDGHLTLVNTIRELEQLLDEDSDGIDVFFGHGSRTFPSGLSQESYHAFLIGRQSSQFVVYDSNDPGRSLECDWEEDEAGLLVSWTCQYKDTKEVTTQRYRLVHKNEYFRVVESALRGANNR